MTDLSVARRDIEEILYDGVKTLPIISPHGHCEPKWFASDAPFPNPSSLLITPDHYVFRMLYSQGISLEDLGIGDHGRSADPREVFRLFASNWHLFLGTPSHYWLTYTFENIFGIKTKLSAETSDTIYDDISSKLALDSFRPRALFDQFNIDLLATTDGANDTLEHHEKIASSSWDGRIVPTFRPDKVLNPAHIDFPQEVSKLGEITAISIDDYQGYLDALRSRRSYFVVNGATATDHAVTDLQTNWLDLIEIKTLYAKALSGKINKAEAAKFYGHMLIEMAQMSTEDGLVMQLHVGATRSTNVDVLEKFGPDMGADIPKAVDWVSGLDTLLNRVGNNKHLTIILFTLDETTYARELAPMVGHWPALRLGPPWWFYDSANGIERYFDQVVETAGYWNLAGFNDDTRAFMSIPARHDLWRRGVSAHLAKQVYQGRFGISDAESIAYALTVDLARQTYRV